MNIKYPKIFKGSPKALVVGYWNARVIKRHVDGKYENGNEYHETYMTIAEVYYDKHDKIWAWSEGSISMQFEDKEEFGEIINQYFDAAQKPILEEIDGKLVETDEVIIPKEMMKKEKKNGKRISN